MDFKTECGTKINQNITQNVNVVFSFDNLTFNFASTRNYNLDIFKLNKYRMISFDKKIIDI